MRYPIRRTFKAGGEYYFPSKDAEGPPATVEMPAAKAKPLIDDGLLGAAIKGTGDKTDPAAEGNGPASED